jgi:Asp-tRNA(Asn)/Glu-tRNA(Gln) amidotransferase A subunit family amidase
MSAVHLRDELRAGRVAPRDVVTAFCDRAELIDGVVHPFTFILRAEAEQRAADSARRIAAGSPRALEGVPFAVKELSAVAGQPHTLGTLLLRDVIAESTDPSVGRLIAAGAIPFARTNTPEFGCASITDNLLFGQTRNPWNLDFSPAGSSGGAATALATFAAPLAQGTDSAGSLRMPAAACGVVGFKPSLGVVPSPAPSYLENVEHHGPMGRDVADVSLMFGVMAGPWDDQLSGYSPRPATARELADLRVTLICDIPELATDVDVKANLRSTAEHMAARGARVEERTFPWPWSRLFRAVKLTYAAMYMPMVKSLLDGGAPLTDLSRAFVDDVWPVSRDYTFTWEARREVAALHAALGEIFADSDLLLMPTLQMPAPRADDHFITAGPIVNGMESADRWIVAFTVPFNLTGSCPAISLPNGMSSAGLPTAAQLIARPYHDLDLLRWAAELEQLLRGER